MPLIYQCKVCNNTSFIVVSELEDAELTQKRPYTIKRSALSSMSLMCSRCNASALLRNVDSLFQGEKK
jgi:hypothetical protein